MYSNFIRFGRIVHDIGICKKKNLSNFQKKKNGKLKKIKTKKFNVKK